jgi:predicted nucleotidyltransferase
MSDDQNLLKPAIPNLILSVGTQVVTRVELRNARNEPLVPEGAVGVVVEAPGDQLHSYRVRFPDGVEGSYRRQHLTIRKHFQQAGYNLPETEDEVNLYEYVIYRCIVGSRAFGLSGDTSDTDWRGIYLPPADLHWSLAGVPEQIESKATEETYWELQKFLNMALKANPNVLECLYTPLVDLATPLAQELLAMRQKFLSKLVYQTYNGYVLSQFKKLEQDLRNRGEIRWKHAMHLLRLLLSGIHVLKEGELMVAVTPEQRTQLLAVKQAHISWEEVDRWRLGLHKEFEAAFATTKLPERPDYAAANAFLLKARRSMVS